jgi:hypothetical protein
MSAAVNSEYLSAQKQLQPAQGPAAGALLFGKRQFPKTSEYQLPLPLNSGLAGDTL